MNNDTPDFANQAFEDAITRAGSEHYVLTLYIAGVTARSSEAIMHIKDICDEHLENRYELEVVDIYQQPELAKNAQILAAPTLIKKLPLPLRKLIGNLSDLDRVLVGLDIVARG